MYLIWSIINATFVILFFALVLAFFAKGKQLFTNKYGNAIITILTVGIIGLLNIKGDNSKNEYVFSNNTNLSKQTTTQIRTIIEDHTLFDISLMVRFQKNNDNEFVPVLTRSYTTGFISGHVWDFSFADIKKIDAKTYSYTVYGSLNWHLFGIKLYGQSKEITGTFVLDR